MLPLPSATDLPTLAAALDAAPVADQLVWLHSLSKKEMKALWAIAGTITVEHFHAGDGQIVEHEGQNDLLPGFDHFEKHFVLRKGQVQGYNYGRWGWAIGPGHFILRGDESGVYVDYTSVPADAPEGWPAVVSNTSGLSRFVYGNMKDFMRKVSDRISVGRAYDADGSDKGHFFVMVRRDPKA